MAIVEETGWRHSSGMRGDFSAVLDALDDAVMVFCLDSWQLLIGNKASSGYCGRSSQEVKQFLRRVGLRSAAAPTDEELAEKLISAAEAPHEPVERIVTDALGRPVWAEITLKRLRPEAGSGRGLLLVSFRNVNRRKHTEVALKEGEERFRRLAETISDIFFRYDVSPNPGFSYLSPAACRILEVSPEELEARPNLIMELTSPGDRYAFSAMQEGRVLERMTISLKSRSGKAVWLEIRGTPVYDRRGRLVAYEGIARDVTERKQMEGQLLRAERLETAGRVAGQVAHDFNNFLAPLATYVELIRRHLPSDHPASDYCGHTERIVHQLADISRDLLALGRRAQVSLQPTDLNQLVKQALEQMLHIPSTLSVEVSLPAGIPPVAGSSAQLLRVVTNLLSNAREAMHDRGRLRVSTEAVRIEKPLSGDRSVKPGDYVRLSVADNGPGISPADLDRIFDPFFSTKAIGERRGSGLGLSIVRTVVEDHEGLLEVETEVGEGTTFYVFLPVWEARPKICPQEVPGGTESILLLDDDRPHRETLRLSLEHLGYDVRCVETGEEAVAAFSERPADLLILEMFAISGMDGVETYRRILDIQPNQRAIMLSGLPETQWVKDGRAMGAGAYLRKPVRPEDLATAVRRELDRPVS